MVKSVIFDVDNTLYSYDNAHEHGWRALCAYVRENLSMDEQTFGREIQKASAKVKERLDADCAALHNRALRFQVLLEENRLPLKHAVAMDELYWDTLIGHSQPEPGILTCLSRLKEAGFVLGIGTDMTVAYQLKKLEALQMLPYFDFLVSSEEANVEKPHGKLFRLCAQKAGVSPEECLFIGDNLKKDVLGSRAAGMQSVWYCPDKARSAAHPEVESISHYDQLANFL